MIHELDTEQSTAYVPEQPETAEAGGSSADKSKPEFEYKSEPESEPIVSISCITFNHGRYLRQALDSFLMQRTDFRFEILIHDDCSTDDTIAIIKEYTAKHPDIIVPMYEEENQYSKGISNISGVFNFPRAKGRYIAMCEGDDYWSDPDKLQKQFDYMEAHPECALCCHGAELLSEDGAFRTVSELKPFAATGIIPKEAFIAKKENIPTASMFFRTEYAKQLPQWYFDCPVGDIPLQLAMLMHGNVYYFAEPMSVYRMGRAGSWGESMESDKAREKWEKHFEAMRRLYEAFDRDTEGSFKAAVSEAVSRSRFLIDIKEDKNEAVLDPANRSFLKELPKTEQRLLVLKARHRGLYELIRSIYLHLHRS